MKCQEFSLIARGLARQQLFGELCDADLRDQAVAHAAECAPCAARLADACNLAAGLRALASQDEPLVAPARVETLLLTAFRQPTQILGSAPNVVPLRARAPRWVWAAAAVLLIGLFTLALRWLLPSGSQAINPNNFAQASPTITVTPAATTAQNHAPRQPNLPVMNQPAAPQRSSPHKLATVRKLPRSRERIERYLVESEIATDFLPLVDTYGLTKPDRLQIIRVEVPRATLASFGLPMSFERATEPIQAELVVGSDGVTRAIRFIQNSFEPAQIISANRPPASNEKER